jgi:hypothetical protein
MKQVSIRYPDAKVQPRVKVLLPLIQEDTEGYTVTASKVLLQALLEGLDVLEKRYGVKS